MVDSKEKNKFDLGVKWLTKFTMWFQQPPTPSLPCLPPILRHFEKGRGRGEGEGVSQVCLGSTGLECTILTCWCVCKYCNLLKQKWKSKELQIYTLNYYFEWLWEKNNNWCSQPQILCTCNFLSFFSEVLK